MSTARLHLVQLAVLASLLVIAFGAGRGAAAPAVKEVAVKEAEKADSQAAASIEEDVVKTAESSGATKVNKKRSQPSLHAANLLAPLQPSDPTPETVSLSPQIPDPVKKGNAIQGVLLNILQPKPIVDSIREEDKYGNTGDKFAFVGRGVVAGFEGFSNILNRVLDFPFETAKKVSRSATEALNNLGSKLIGL